MSKSSGKDQSFSRGLSLTSLGAILGIGLDFCAFTFAARNVSKADFGIFALFLVIGRFAQVASDVGLRQTVVQHLSSGALPPDRTFQLALTIQTITATLIAGTLLAFGVTFPSTVPNHSAGFFVYLAAFVMVQGWHQLFSGTLQGLRLYRSYIAGELTRSLVRLALMLVLVTRVKLGLHGLMLSAVLGVMCAAIFQAGLIPLPKRFWVTIPALRRTAAFALPLAANGALGITFDRLNRLILGFWAGPVSLALYETASRIPDAGIQVYLGFQSAFFPNMSAVLGAGGKRHAAVILNQTFRLISFAVATAAVIAYALRREIIVLLFSRQYADSATAFGILAPVIVVAISNNLLQTTLIASGNSRGALKAGLFQGLITIVLDVILIPKLGYLGPVYGYIAGNVLVNPFVLGMVRKQGIYARAQSYAKPMALCLLAITAAAAINGPWLGLAAGLFLFFALGAVTGCVTKDDIQLLIGENTRDNKSNIPASRITAGITSDRVPEEPAI